MKKSTWKREVKTKIKEKIRQRLTDDFCRKEEDTTKHVLDCEVELEKGKHTIGSSNINHWKQILKIFRDNKNKRKA